MHPGVQHYQHAVGNRDRALKAVPGSEDERMYTEMALTEGTLAIAKYLESLVIVYANAQRVARPIAMRGVRRVVGKSRRWS